MSCQKNKIDTNVVLEKINLNPDDTHSYARPDQARINHLELTLEVDFKEKLLKGNASYEIAARSDAKEIILDTKNLKILSVYVNDSSLVTNYSLKPKDDLLGQALHIPIDNLARRIQINYETTTGAEALQWLYASQTAGNDPFLFTQSQAILCRSWIPIQDSPSIKFTYNASIKVPQGYLALMSATNPQKVDSTGAYSFKMENKIPAYLMALAVGKLAFHKYDSLTGVYAEPATLELAKEELADMHLMLKAAEDLYGLYKWGRFDVLMLPPSFPFGGMENPTLTFATPTILAGDKSLTSLIAHELAHSWSGNLVTNATWEDFWLNEGFTVYFEYRIMEAVYGKDYVDMLALISRRELTNEVATMMADSNGRDTRLKLDLKDRNPDEGLTAIAYDKGYFFLRRLEELAGRENFDTFLARYFSDYAFETMSTEAFIIYCRQHLFVKNNIDLPENFFSNWIFEEGLPSDMPNVKSVLFQGVEIKQREWLQTKNDSLLMNVNWSTHEWLHFLHKLHDSIGYDILRQLDQLKDFTHTGNAEIKTEWMLLAIKNNYRPVLPELERFLINTGRRKFLMPLYEALLESDMMNNAGVLRIYGKARSNYHFVTYNSLDSLLNYN